MTVADTFSQALEKKIPELAYSVSRQLAERFPEKHILETHSCSFELLEYHRDGHCEAALLEGVHNQLVADWDDETDEVTYEPAQTWTRVAWQGHTFEIVTISWPENDCTKRCSWIIASDKNCAEMFFRAVCAWCSEVRDEVLVYEQGYWRKSKELYAAIKKTTYAAIVLAGDLKSRIDEDFQRFLSSRDLYDQYNVPWKRGVLFVGPPGNGKTQMVKAVINALGRPCLYVKSLASHRGDEHACVRSVFERARATTPCVLVLEDLDSLVTAGNRSFFLNELDGFASNRGIIVLATTNHPERLDPAILDRPSRFDRKYHFNLPETPERVAYLKLWNGTLEPALKLSEEGIGMTAACTQGFSFAYLKELMLASVMSWMDRPGTSPMDAILASQALLLREQMAHTVQKTPTTDDESTE